MRVFKACEELARPLHHIAIADPDRVPSFADSITHQHSTARSSCANEVARVVRQRPPCWVISSEPPFERFSTKLLRSTCALGGSGRALPIVDGVAWLVSFQKENDTPSALFHSCEALSKSSGKSRMHPMKSGTTAGGCRRRDRVRPPRVARNLVEQYHDYGCAISVHQ